MLIIGHRGASGYAPENTLASFEIALEQGCSGIELDVQQTKDGQLVVIHDFSVDRTTNGTGIVSHMYFDEIRKLDAGSWFDSNFAGEKIPTLLEVLNLVPQNILLNIEIKLFSSENTDIEQRLVNLLLQNNRTENVIISSFDHTAIKKVQEINPHIKTGLLLYGNLLRPIDYIVRNELKIFSAHPSQEHVTSVFVDEMHNHGIPVYSYTVNDMVAFKRCVECQVDGIMTNYPDRFRKSY